ncbi:nmr-1 [Pristionchus pacificus]|nr:nmr-1 [Pristionchus pacificus]
MGRTQLFPLFILLHSITFSYQYSVSVLIFGHDFESARESIQRSLINQFGSIPISIRNQSFDVNMVHAGYANKSNSQLMSDTICGSVLNGSVVVLLYSSIPSHSYLRLASSTSLSLGFYRVPTIAVGLREDELNKKRLYPTLVTSTPSFADESSVFLQLLTTLNYGQVSLITMRGDSNGLRFAQKLINNAKLHKIHVQKQIVLDGNSNVTQLNESLTQHFEEITSNVILLFAIKKDAYRLFSICDWLLKGKVWIVNEDASEAINAPNGHSLYSFFQSSYILGLLAPQLNLDMEEAMRDSLETLRNGLEVITGDEQPPISCAKKRDQWTNQDSPRILNALCSTRTAKIRFDSHCRREFVDYNVVNILNGEKMRVGEMIGEKLMLSREKDILWPGEGHRPFEISLPRNLKVLIVSDPPFVYSIPATSTNCSSLSIEPVTITPNQIIPIKGDWFPCWEQLGPSPHPRHSFCCTGYAIDLLNRLSQPQIGNKNSLHHLDTSFSFELRLVSSYGAVTASSSSGYNLSGAIQLLADEEADMAIGAITINPEREQFVDFSEPWLYHGIRIVEKATPRASPMQSFLQPLQSSLWISLLISVIAVGIVIYLLDINSPFKAFYVAHSDDSSSEDRVGLGEAMWFVWGVLLNSGVSEKTPRSGSARVLAVVWCGFCMIVIASYTANLAAFLVLDQPEKSLTGISDPRLRNPSANFSFGTLLHSNVYQYFKRHVELSTVFRKMEAHNVEKVEDAITSLLNGKMDAFIWDSIRIDWEASRNCELRPRGSLFGRSAYGVALQKGSPWTPHITTAILNMAESGVMEGLDHKWIGEPNGMCIPDAVKAPDRLGLSSMRDLFVLLTLAVTFGAILSLIEVSFGRHRQKTAQNRKLALRYGRRWFVVMKKRRMVPRTERALSYNLDMIVYRRGFAGLQTLSLQEAWRNNLIRRKQNPSRIEKEQWRPIHNFSSHPTILFCTRCRGLVETHVEYRAGIFAYLSIIVMSLLLLWPCAPLPCFLSFFSDYVHICPVCSHRIARARKIGTKSFYV